MAIDGRARCAWSWLAGLAFAQPGTILVGPTGETLRVREDGGVDQVLPGGHPRPSVAADPLNTRRAI